MADARISDLAARGGNLSLEDLVELSAIAPGSPTQRDNYRVTLGELVQLLGVASAPGGRLTLESGVPVSTSDQAAKTSVYYTPYVHNVIRLWDGSTWKPVTFAETTLALGTLTNDLPYDVFGYLNAAGALALELLAWSSKTARATATTHQDGRLCKDGDKTRLYLGSFHTTSTTTTEDSTRKRLLYNYYNQQPRLNEVTYSVSHTYSGTSTRQMNSVTTNQFESMIGQPQAAVINLSVSISTSGSDAVTSLGINSTTAESFLHAFGNTQTWGVDSISRPVALPAAYRFYSLNQRAYGGSSTTWCHFSNACRGGMVVMI